MSAEVAAAIIAGLATLVLGIWQTRGTLKEQARLSAGATLLPLRHEAYQGLWKLTNVGPEDKPEGLGSEEKRRCLAKALTDWYYPDGLLLSDGSWAQWQRVRDALRAPGELDVPAQRALRAQISLLRSWLKADLFIRTIDEVSAAARDLRTRPSEEFRSG